MAKKRSFGDDGWAIWVTGDDTSTFYLNQWVTPKGKNYVDVAVRIRSIANTHDLNVYIPFNVTEAEIEDLSFHFKDEGVFRAIFSSRCIMEFMKNKCTSELAYHGKTVDLVHFSNLGYQLKPVAEGTQLTISIDDLKQYLDNDETYFIFRLPHKNLDQLFKPKGDIGNKLVRIREMVASPIISERFACSVRVNEARLLPEEINKLGAFHRQKLNKAVVTLALSESYQVNDSNCYRIHRTEEELFGNYAPQDFDCKNAITYEWNESREKNLYGHFNFYFGITRDSVSRASVFLYIFVLLCIGLLGNFISTLIGI